MAIEFEEKNIGESIEIQKQAENVEVRVAGAVEAESDESVEEEDSLLYLSITPTKQGSNRGTKRPERPINDLDESLSPICKGAVG